MCVPLPCAVQVFQGRCSRLRYLFDKCIKVDTRVHVVYWKLHLQGHTWHTLYLYWDVGQ